MSLQGDNPLPEMRAKQFFMDVIRGLSYSSCFLVIRRSDSRLGIVFDPSYSWLRIILPCERDFCSCESTTCSFL